MNWIRIRIIVSVLLAVPAFALSDPLTISPSTLGNVFVLGESIEIPVSVTGADRVIWEARNLFGRVSDKRTVHTVGNNAVIAPEIAVPGWYRIDIDAYDGDKLVTSGHTTLAVLEPLAESHNDSRFGVQTHFAQGWDTDILPLIAKAGIGHVRDEQYWSKVEVQKNRFKIPERYSRYMAELAANRIQILLALTFGNEFYDYGDTPYTESGRAGFARYGQELLHRYEKQISALEIWNEFNGSWCSGPCRDDRPLYYTALLRDTYRAIKQLRPSVKVVGGVTARIPLPYFERLFRYGALSYMDVVSVHPYGSPPSVVDRHIEELRDLIKLYNNGQSIPIWVTETSLQDEGPEGRLNVARYLVQQTTALLGARVERVYWYLLRDYQNFTTMGLLHDEHSALGRYVPTPAYVAEAVLIRQLGGATALGRQTSDPRTRIYRFDRRDDACLVMWTIGPQSTTIEIQSDTSVTVIDFMGNAKKLVPTNGKVSLTVDQNPTYVAGGIGRVRERRLDRVLAVSTNDFTEQQGGNGWFYGFRIANFDASYTPEDFKQLVWSNDEWMSFWTNLELRSLRISAGNMHPANQGDSPVWAIRRWRSDFAGEIKISINITKGSQAGDGVSFLLLVDGIPKYSVDIGGEHNTLAANYSIKTAAQVGTVFDFVVTPGPGRDVDFDSISFSAVITTQN